MTKEKLTKDAWIAAGFRALAEHGPNAIQIKLLAVALGATKGSFYWHFSDLAAFKSEMLSLWRSKVASEVITEVMAEPDPRKRLGILLTSATTPPPDDYGGRKIEPAMRAWALSDPMIEQALGDVDTLRREFLMSLFNDLGLDAAPLAELTYAAYIGLDDLQSKGRADMSAALIELLGLIHHKLDS